MGWVVMKGSWYEGGDMCGMSSDEGVMIWRSWTGTKLRSHWVNISVLKRIKHGDGLNNLMFIWLMCLLSGYSWSLSLSAFLCSPLCLLLAHCVWWCVPMEEVSDVWLPSHPCDNSKDDSLSIWSVIGQPSSWSDEWWSGLQTGLCFSLIFL